MQNIKRIQRASKRLSKIMMIIFFVLPLLNVFFWLFVNEWPELLSEQMVPSFVSMPLPVLTRLMAIAVTMMPIGITMLGVFYLMRLFQYYEQGIIFDQVNVLCFKKLSRVLIWWFFVGIVSRSILSVVLTLHNPVGQRMITVDLQSPDITALLVGCILAVIAWVMEEGRRIQKDQELTV